MRLGKRPSAPSATKGRIFDYRHAIIEIEKRKTFRSRIIEVEKCGVCVDVIFYLIGESPGEASDNTASASFEHGHGKE